MSIKHKASLWCLYWRLQFFSSDGDGGSVQCIRFQMPKVREVQPNMETHPAFGEALERAKLAGVKILMIGCDVQPDSLRVDEERMDTVIN